MSAVFVYTHLNVKVLFQTIRFSISTQFSSIRPIDRTLSGSTNPGQCGPGSDGNEGVLHIPQSSSFTGTLPSNCLVSYAGYSLGRLLLCRDAVGVLYSPSRLGHIWFKVTILFLMITICLHTIIWFQVFLSNTNNLHIAIWIQEPWSKNIMTPM